MVSHCEIFFLVALVVAKFLCVVWLSVRYHKHSNGYEWPLRQFTSGKKLSWLFLLAIRSRACMRSDAFEQKQNWSFAAKQCVDCIHLLRIALCCLLRFGGDSWLWDLSSLKNIHAASAPGMFAARLFNAAVLVNVYTTWYLSHHASCLRDDQLQLSHCHPKPSK